MANPIINGSYSSDQSVYEVSTTQRQDIGERGVLSDGRVFYYCSYTASATLSTGALSIVGARTAAHLSVAYASGGAAETNTVTVTLGAGAATQDQYAEGVLAVIDGTGSGQARKIRSHPAASGSATLEITTYDPWKTAISSAELSLQANQFAAPVVSPGNSVAHRLAGVPQVDVPAGNSTTQYFWNQTGGWAMVQGDGSAFTDGALVVAASAGTADAGQVTLGRDAGTGTGAGSSSITIPPVGYVIEASDATSDADFRLVDLVIKL